MTIPRIGHGYDIHRLAEGRKLILGGVEVPFDKGLIGHSDADIVIHALIDALLGAAALGDIGSYFPDTDPAYKGVDSADLLKETIRMIREKSYRIGNIDITVIAQRPKLAPYIRAVRDNLASILGIDVDDISVKAKTNENVDATGCGEAMAAHTVAIIYHKSG